MWAGQEEARGRKGARGRIRRKGEEGRSNGEEWVRGRKG